MPNGGSDNCGTCWHNSNHPGTAGQAEGWDLPCRCLLRRVDVLDPLFTYCANHPYHDKEKRSFPVGPIYAAETIEDGFHHRRKAWVPGPDTPEVREGLLKIASELPEAPPGEYPSPTKLETEAIKQLGELEEPRAVPALRRILGFHPLQRGPLACAPGEIAFGAGSTMDRQALIGSALAALARILGSAAAAEIAPFARAGLTKAGQPLEVSEKLAELRLGAVRALALCGPAGRKALSEAASDPVLRVAEEARLLLA